MKKLLSLLLIFNALYSVSQEVPAHYKGGEEAMQYFVRKNLNLSENDLYQGEMFVRLTISEKGMVIGKKIEKSVDPNLDQMVLSVIDSMPAWLPATKDGEPVVSTVLVPFNFSYPEQIAHYDNIYNEIFEYIKNNLSENFSDLSKIEEGISSISFMIKDGEIICTPIKKNYRKEEIKELKQKYSKENVDSIKINLLKSINYRLYFNKFHNTKLDKKLKNIINAIPLQNIRSLKNNQENIYFDLEINLINKSHNNKLPLIFDEESFKENNTNNTSDNLLIENNTDGIYISFSQYPIFRGGIQLINSFLKKNLKYPEECLSKGIEGRVIVRFLVEKSGSISDITSLSTSVHPLLQQEAIRVVTLLSVYKNFIPGFQKGRPVKTYYSIPVNFKLKMIW